MSTAISLAPPAPVGSDMQARRIEPGDIVLIEPHLVGGILLGEGREVVALVIWVDPRDGGRNRLIDWAGVVPGHDGTDPTTGSSLYERASAITVLGHIGQELAA